MNVPLGAVAELYSLPYLLQSSTKTRMALHCQRNVGDFGSGLNHKAGIQLKVGLTNVDVHHLAF